MAAGPSRTPRRRVRESCPTDDEPRRCAATGASRSAGHTRSGSERAGALPEGDERVAMRECVSRLAGTAHGELVTTEGRTQGAAYGDAPDGYRSGGGGWGR